MTTRSFFSRGAGIAALLMTVTAVALQAAPPQPDAPMAPHRQVDAFLKFHLTHDSGLTQKNIEARRKWLSPALYRLLEKEIVRQNAFEAKHPGDVPFIDGDVFTSAQEQPNGFAVSAAPERHGIALVPVTFRFGEKPSRALYRMHLSDGNARKQWQIDDVIADGESLVKTLQRPDYQTPPASKAAHRRR